MRILRRTQSPIAILIGAFAAACPCLGPGTPATLTPINDPPGYAIEGEWDFAGTLTKASESGPWLLEGSFTFPTSGYDLAQPEVQIAESFPEQVFIQFKVTPPPPGSIVAQMIVEAPVSFTIDVAEGATFDIRFVQGCY